MEEYRTLCNQLKHTLAFTQSEYETQKAEYQRIVEEYKLSAEAEVNDVENNIDKYDPQIFMKLYCLIIMKFISKLAREYKS